MKKKKRRLKPQVKVKVMTEWMSANEATEYLRLPSKRALYQMVDRAKIPAFRLGKKSLIFSRSDLDQHIRSRPVIPTPRKKGVKPS